MFEQTSPAPETRVTKLKRWIKTHPRKSYAIGGCLLFLAALLGTVLVLSKPPETKPVSTMAQPPTPPPVYYSPLTGEKVTNEAATTQPVTAVMIENSPDARPQSGLKQAQVVYEAVAEGGITRFLALYQQQKPKLIGPVRSVRMYYVDWVTPYNASVAHVGGSAKALKLVRNGSYRDIDQFFNPNSYWRATDRYAPHNVYTSSSRLDALNKKKGFTASAPKMIVRDDVNESETQNARKVNITISSPLYNSSYSYNAKTKLYARSQGGEAHRDREKGRIQAKVVVALRVNMETVFEDGYRESIRTSGKGKAVVFQNGHATKVTWQKKSRSRELQFYNSDGKPFPLARGVTWIAAVPNDGGKVSWK